MLWLLELCIGISCIGLVLVILGLVLCLLLDLDWLFLHDDGCIVAQSVLADGSIGVEDLIDPVLDGVSLERPDPYDPVLDEHPFQCLGCHHLDSPWHLAVRLQYLERNYPSPLTWVVDGDWVDLLRG